MSVFKRHFYTQRQQRRVKNSTKLDPHGHIVSWNSEKRSTIALGQDSERRKNVHRSRREKRKEAWHREKTHAYPLGQTRASNLDVIHRRHHGTIAANEIARSQPHWRCVREVAGKKTWRFSVSLLSKDREILRLTLSTVSTCPFPSIASVRALILNLR